MKSYLAHDTSNLKPDAEKALPDTAAQTDKQPRQYTQHYLSRLFKDLSVKTLFLPATKKNQLKDLSKLAYHELTEDFREELEKDVKPHIFGSLKSKSFSDQQKSMTGRELQRAIHFIVNALRNGVFPELPSLWASWTSQVAEHSLQDSERWFRTMVLEQ